MFKAWITRDGDIFEGVVYQIVLVASRLCAVYRLPWEGEWNVTDIQNIKPKMEGIKMSKKISCPAYSCDCPYWEDGFCTMYERGDGHPKDDCDDYYAYTGDEED